MSKVKLLLMIFSTMVIYGCKKEEANCRDCAVLEYLQTGSGTTWSLIYEGSFKDCQSTASDEDRVFQEGNFIKRRIVKCM